MVRNIRRRTTRNRGEFQRLAVQNIQFSRKNWGISSERLAILRALTEELQLSAVRGDLRLLDGKSFVTRAGFPRLAQRHRSSGIQTQLRSQLSEPAADRWVFRATAYKTPRSRGFVG